MHIPDSLWGASVYLVNIVTFSSLADSPTPQQHVLNDLPNHSGDPLAHVTNAPTSSKDSDYPIFEPPSGSKNDDFKCVYPGMVGWKQCSTPGNRGCWLKKGDDEFNITTNYEVIPLKGNILLMPRIFPSTQTAETTPVVRCSMDNIQDHGSKHAGATI